MKKSKKSGVRAAWRGARRLLLFNSRRNTSRKTDTLDLELTTARGG
jgi:hypothetical protein